MVAIRAYLRSIEVGVVPNQLRVPVIGVAEQKAVIALEPESQRPARERTGARPFTARREMPFADGHRAPTGIPQQAWQRLRRIRDLPV